VLASRLVYYASSIPTMVLGIEGWTRAAASLLGFRDESFAIRVRKRDLRLRVRDFMDVWVAKETLLDGDYDPALPETGTAGVILDVGAGIGDFALLASRLFGKSRVLAFEPYPESFEILEENLAANGAHNVETTPLGVAGRGVNQRWLSPGAHGASSVSADVDEANAPEPVVAEFITLDAALARFGVDRVAFLKMDVEGAEFEIFRDAADETLARIDRISLEYHDGEGRDHEEIAARLASSGFRVTRRPSRAHAHLGYLDAVRPPGAGAA